ncbi:MAG: hypothetical protein IPF53_05480 [Blastocatellia bacterium]|nr:hypothetical protein [Blastocatellia bacterium]
MTRAQLDSMIRLRVEALPAPVRRLLETTAVAGQPVPLKVATRAAEIERDENAILARLRSEHLIRVREAGKRKEIESYHDRIRETVVAGIDESQLKAYHLGLAKAWEQVGEADAETLARHYYEAGMPQQALGFVIAAANKRLILPRVRASGRILRPRPRVRRRRRRRLAGHPRQARAVPRERRDGRRSREGFPRGRRRGSAV